MAPSASHSSAASQTAMASSSIGTPSGILVGRTEVRRTGFSQPSGTDGGASGISTTQPPASAMMASRAP
ncbi:hypothetical protein AZL_011570 [Azospirillum sp. B510]|nr:hypothetical protein AZL_011570 [Azospirillum sp. B510]